MDSSTLVSVYTPLSNEQKNSPEVKNEPSGILNTPLSGVPDGTKTSGSQMTDSEYNSQWTEVRRKKRQNQVKKSPASPVPRESKNVLTPGHARAVQEAKRQLTTPQRELIERCTRTVEALHSFKFGRPSNNVSRGEGPSKGKGKGPDPGNWGDVDFSDEEIDLDAQRAALESWKAAQEWARSQSDTPRIKELPAGNAGVGRGQAILRMPAPAETSVATEVARTVEPSKNVADSASDGNESSVASSLKKHKKKRTHKKKVRTQKPKDTEDTQDASARLGNADPVRALVNKTVAQLNVRRE